jgi:hypothetical protein
MNSLQNRFSLSAPAAKSKFLAVVVTVIPFLGLFSTPTCAWSLKQAPVMTQWAKQVDPNKPLPEYPRPQLIRTDWLNLNGVWQFQSGNNNDPVPVGKTLSGDILVPFPVESAISGVMQHYERVWYRRTFTVPVGWTGRRIMLNFGAVDWESEVYINGKSLGVHHGSYDPFSYDITSYLVGTDPQELIVRVFNPVENGGQPRGKQAMHGIPIMYTPTTGIWQTVWLEPVPQTGISGIKIVPNIDNSTVNLTVNTVGSTSGISVSVQVKDGGAVVQNATGTPNAESAIPISNPKLWSPEHPFLYDLTISLVQNGTAVDSVTSYFGMRKISIGTDGGHQKMLLNNQFVFELGPLDQGFWPDGIYTAPTESAMAYDLQLEKAMGFNMVRKHVKVEPYRWYYWADKLGLMVWQDMPTAQSYGGVDADPTEYSAELTQMVQTHWNSPCIIMWDLFNEECGEAAVTAQIPLPTLVQNVMTLDPSRLVNEASGYKWSGSGNVADNHSYPVPGATPGAASQAIACGEFGGIKYLITGHEWGGNNGVDVNNVADYLSRYDSYAKVLSDLQANHGLSAAVYTQTTDVETECNGIVTYDRAALKADINEIKSSNEKVLGAPSGAAPSSQSESQSWNYTTAAPEPDWCKASYFDSAWSSGDGGFGAVGTPGAAIRTSWTTPDIWLRKEFKPGTLSAADIGNLIFNVYPDEDCEIYMNGIQAAGTSHTSGYVLLQIDQAGKDTFASNKTNLIAVHCHQAAGSHGLDVGMLPQ